MKVEHIGCDLPQVISDVVSLMRRGAGERAGVQAQVQQPAAGEGDDRSAAVAAGAGQPHRQRGSSSRRRAGELGVSCGRVAGLAATLRFDVSDTGIGITPIRSASCSSLSTRRTRR
jgi:hypothetical protein